MANEKKAIEPQLILTTAKVKRLIIKNFRCIGPEPVSIDLDDIVILVGPNNAGKSTILRAYEVVMLHGSLEGRLKLEDFPRELVDAENLPEIELQTYVSDDLPSEQWIHLEGGTGKKYIRERWIWEAVGKEPKRQGHRANQDDWDDRVPWGAPNVANSRRPIPCRVDAFASPEEQGDRIIKLLQQILAERASKAPECVSAVEQLTQQIRELQKQIVKDSQGDIAALERDLSNHIGDIFVGFQVSLDTRNEEVTEKAFNMFSAKPVIRMGLNDDHMAPMDKQGSGARRTLLWSALKIASERQPKNQKAGSAIKGVLDKAEPLIRPHVLLLDEPEICLHPAAVRDACRVLYDLAAAGSGWQVMVTTHAPAFIDISRDNTTVVRVERTARGAIAGTTVFRPEVVQLSPDDQELIKLLNQWDPYVGEFFFGGRTIVVEGDTEYAAFREIIESNRSKYRGVHVVRARGKFIIPIIVKILNHFGSPYAVLHDSDVPKTAKGKGNPAWAGNEKIRVAVAGAPRRETVRMAASIPDFEHAMFNERTASDKPYNAVFRLRRDAAAKARVEKLLNYLLFSEPEPPSGILPWDNISELENAVANLTVPELA